MNIALYMFGTIALASLVGLALALTFQSNKVAQMQISVNNLRKALDEMDEQAKLVVRTDIELNKAQEELDKKLTGLYTLQQISREISSTLEESQIFTKISTEHLEALGFDKAAAFLWQENNRMFVHHLAIGYPAEEMEPIRSGVETNKDFFLDMITHDRMISSISEAEARQKETLRLLFKVSSFVLCPVRPKEGCRGLLIVGTDAKDSIITEGDEELIVILANQLSQGLDNARLFEKTWSAHQEMEKRVEERTRELSLALEEVNTISKRKSDFVSSVSHELRTPLTSIKGYAAILLAGKLGTVPPEAQKRLEKINKHSDELVQFVNDLLDIARLESGTVTMKLIPFEIKTLADEVADMLSVLMKDKSIEFSCSVAEGLPETLGDKDQIKRVFINLINNAIKYSPQGKITVSVKQAADTIQVDVSDTGCGIPENAAARIFEEFYRVDSEMNQEIKGTGLGLSLVKNIIEAHKGKIWVKSKVGEGSTFSFTLPVAKPL
jgi:signal transduction histidine kinase/Skp family chaperone for outer membrane proteins